jgi:hypothetical protein
LEIDGSTQSIARALNALNGLDAREAFGRAARSAAEQRGIARMVDAHLALYERLQGNLDRS